MSKKKPCPSCAEKDAEIERLRTFLVARDKALERLRNDLQDYIAGSYGVAEDLERILRGEE